MQANEILKRIRPCDRNEPFVFISYSSLDNHRVWEDVLRFQQMGYNVWLDEKNLDKTRASWREDALEAIRDFDCTLVVFYVSRNSLVSQACFSELECTVDEITQATHNGPVKFVAVDVEPIDDIIQFQQQVYADIRSKRELSKEEKTSRVITLRKCIDQFFNSNNEKVRVKAHSLPNRKMDYYEEIVAAFTDETRVFPAGEENPAAEPVKKEPERKEPASKKSPDTAAPAEKVRPSEVLEMPFDFLEDIRLKFQKDFGDQKGSKEDGSSQSAEKAAPKIPLAAIRREREPFTGDFTIVDTSGNDSRAYTIEEFLIPQNGQWILADRVRPLPYSEEKCNGEFCRTFLLEEEQFTDDTEHNGLILTASEDRGKGSINSYLITNSHMYVSKNPGELGIEELDEAGYYMDFNLENLFAFCDFEGETANDFWQPVCWRRSVSEYKPEYLGYLILDARTMEEIPKSFSRSPRGGYQLSVVLPCPSRLIVLKITSDSGAYVDASWAVTGYLHGIYGMKKNPDAAERLMRKGAEAGDAKMAFEYGAFLKREGKLKQAETYLRGAAQENIPGAKFELAELLLDNRAEDNEAREEARQLIDSLLIQGCRTYGHAISIDLLGEHQQSEQYSDEE